MSGIRGLRRVALVGLLAVVGAYLSHTAEFIRVWGTTSLPGVLGSSVHAYLIPLGFGLALVLGLASAAWARAWRLATRRLDHARLTAVRLLRGGRPPAAPAAPAEAPSGTPAASAWRQMRRLWPQVMAVQVPIYLVQEHVESARIGVDAGWLAPVSGVHSLAPAIHALVALLVTVYTLLAALLLRSREAAAARLERCVRRIVEARLRPLGVRPRPVVDVDVTRVRLEAIRRQRPPPQPAAPRPVPAR